MKSADSQHPAPRSWPGKSDLRKERTRLRLIIIIPVLMVCLPIFSGVIQFNVFDYYTRKTESLQQALDDSFIVLMLTSGLLVLVAAVFGALLAYYITKQINRMINLIDMIAQGNLDTSIDIRTQDEFSNLGRSFNHMIQALNHTIAERNQLILECYTGGLITMGADSRISAMNKAAEQILELSAADVMGKKIKELEKMRRGIEPLIEFSRMGLDDGQMVHSVETSILRADGSPFPLVATTSILRGQNDEIRGLSLNIRDLTKYKSFHHRLNRTDRLATAGTLAMGVAHEIRNPLASIRGMAQLLQQDIPEGSESRKFADIIAKESLRLDHVVRELLDFSQPDESNLEIVSLDELAARALHNLKMRDSGGKKNIQLRETYGGLPQKNYFAEKLLQAFNNILENAYEFAPEENGFIEVKTQLAEEEDERGAKREVQCVAISNNGPPIPHEDRDHIFEPFYSHREGGSGLGLSITYQIVNFNGGSIDVLSDEERTTFRLSFPL